jgi:hypothetical protein
MTVDQPRPPDAVVPDWTETVTGRATATASAASDVTTTHRGTEPPRAPWISFLGASVSRCVAIVDSSELMFRLNSSELWDYFASGSGRIWNFITLLVVPLPVSMWNGVLVEIVVQMPRPFQPALGSSMRPSIHFV